MRLLPGEKDRGPRARLRYNRFPRVSHRGFGWLTLLVICGGGLIWRLTSLYYLLYMQPVRFEHYFNVDFYHQDIKGGHEASDSREVRIIYRNRPVNSYRTNYFRIGSDLDSFEVEIPGYLDAVLLHPDSGNVEFSLLPSGNRILRVVDSNGLTLRLSAREKSRIRHYDYQPEGKGYALNVWDFKIRNLRTASGKTPHEQVVVIYFQNWLSLKLRRINSQRINKVLQE